MSVSIPIVRPRTTKIAVLGVVISFLREEKKIKQGAFAQSIGMSSPSVSKMEQGTNTITYDTLLQIAQSFQLEVSDILRITEKLSALLQNMGIHVFNTEKDIKDLDHEHKNDSAILVFMSGKILKTLIKNTDTLYQNTRHNPHSLDTKDTQNTQNINT